MTTKGFFARLKRFFSGGGKGTTPASRPKPAEDARAQHAKAARAAAKRARKAAQANRRGGR